MSWQWFALSKPKRCPSRLGSTHPQVGSLAPGIGSSAVIKHNTFLNADLFCKTLVIRSIVLLVFFNTSNTHTTDTTQPPTITNNCLKDPMLQIDCHSILRFGCNCNLSKNYWNQVQYAKLSISCHFAWEGKTNFFWDFPAVPLWEPLALDGNSCWKWKINFQTLFSVFGLGPAKKHAWFLLTRE